ncbi:hypothetical protein BJP78_24945 [Mycobacterium avium subsp. hominissuis]|nr:hypothetical protein BEP52_24365 [Mycobacterium avium subsp. hominissuis]QWY63497.1 hypothetical protein BJP74_24025 [Mycobacterium avium subsp. hominissuis]QWY64957.1 hypothetical protein BJP78_24945 [Mycobacterium avium subsp. hominissuis]BAN33704.1 hypothetical protein MAH_4630 [Mycobacterium avium subsp. hominissuis TH135]
MAGGFFGGAGGRGDARAGRTERDAHPGGTHWAGGPVGHAGGVGGWIPGVAADRGHGAAVIRRRVDLAAVIRRGAEPVIRRRARPAAGQRFT